MRQPLQDYGISAAALELKSARGRYSSIPSSFAPNLVSY